MESRTMKTLDILAPVAAPSLLIESAVLARALPAIPVEQAIAALGEPESLAELAQRLVATVSMLWSDVAGADLFVPHGGAGELRAVCNPLEGHVLLSAVASPYAVDPAVRVVPVTPSLVAGDRGVGCGSTMSAPLDTAGGNHAHDSHDSHDSHDPRDQIVGFIVLQRR